MTTILEALATGNLCTSAPTIRNNHRYCKAFDRVIELEDQLLTLLHSEEEKKLLHEMIDQQMDMEDSASIDRFIYGYRLGALMMIEVFTAHEKPLTFEEE